MGETERLGVFARELNELITVEKEFKELSETEKKLNEEREGFLKEAKEQGKKFVVCENCGTLMEVNVNGD